MTVTIRDAMTAPALVDPITALTDDNLLAPMLPGIHEGSWNAWLVIVRGLYGLPMDDEQAAVWRELTQREPPSEPLRAAFMLCGRRAGKTQIAAALTLYETALRDWSGIRSAGELIVGAMVAADRRQAGQALRYIRGGLEGSAMLSAMVVKDGSEGIELSNGTELAVMTSNHRSIRGRSFAALVADELCHWHQEGASPDAEIIRAAEPALSLTDGLLLGISTPHRRDGVLYSRYKRHWAQDSETLVVQAASRRMNERLPQSVVDDAMAEDEQSARAEYLAQWRDDLAGYVTRPVVEALIRPGVTELPPREGVRHRGFVDVSGGASDSFTWAIAHTTRDGVDVLDLVREERPPFSPAAIVAQCAADMRRYGIRAVTGDRYGAAWVSEQFRKAGLKYLPAEMSRSEIYLDALPRLTSGRAELLDHDRLIKQLTALERKTRSGGRDSVDHPRGGSDDVANAAMGALVCNRAPRKRAGTW